MSDTDAAIRQRLATELGVRESQITATVGLFDEGATVPFVARYRKEATGTLDEVQVRDVRDRIAQLRELHARREAMLKSLKERELLTDELYVKVLAAANMTSLEDVYLPYRPKRRTRAAIAREKGLQPLADAECAQFGRRAVYTETTTGTDFFGFLTNLPLHAHYKCVGRS